MQVYKIKWARESDVDEICKIAKDYQQAFSNWQFQPNEIIKIIRHKRKLMLKAELDGEIVGFNVAEVRPAICYDAHLFVCEPHRFRGVGGALVLSLLRFLKQWKVQGYEFHKWYAEVPHYNDSVYLYQAMNFPLDGIWRKHTRAKTDLWLFSFYLDEMEIPAYGSYLKRHTPYPIDDSEILSSPAPHCTEDKKRLSEVF